MSARLLFTVDEVASVNLIGPIVPFMFLLIFVEAIVGYITDRTKYRFNNSFNSLSMGACDRVIEVFTRRFEAVVYVFVYNNFAVVHLSTDSYYTWILGIITIDFLYYWFHRLGHEANVMWTTHQSHHSSEDFNITTALRQNAFQSLIGWIFYAPGALFIPPPVLLASKQIDLMYQIWIHTEVIDKMGPLEYIFNTPSHHRVHHGRNLAYIDKNYAGVYHIGQNVWYFEEEKQTVVYGITTPIKTWDIVVAQCGHWVDICNGARTLPGLKNKLKVMFYGPGWKLGDANRLGNINEIPEPNPSEPKYDIGPPIGVNIYLLLNGLLILQGVLVLTEQHAHLSLSTQLLLSVTILFSLASFGYIMDHKKYALKVELVRVLAIFVGTVVYLASPYERIFFQLFW